MANGLDDLPVETEHRRKSVGAETTFPRDLSDGPELRQVLGRVAQDVARRLQKKGVEARTVTLKLRDSDFRTITRPSSRSEGVARARHRVAAAGGVRVLFCVRTLVPMSSQQAPFVAVGSDAGDAVSQGPPRSDARVVPYLLGQRP